MTDAQFAAYEAYLRELAARMLLQDWEIDLDRSRPTGENVWAEVRIPRTENYASVSVAWPDFFHQRPERQREYLTHELVHCHFTRMHNVMTQSTDHYSESVAAQFTRDAWVREMEIAVQRVARILAPQLPLPPEISAPPPESPETMSVVAQLIDITL